MNDFAIVWLKERKGPCVFCGEETGVDLVGWHHGDPVGPVCDACMLERERILGVLLSKSRAPGPRNEFAIVWLEDGKVACVLCAGETGVGAVGWHQFEPIGPVCDGCMVQHERILGAFLRRARAQGNGGVH